MQWIDTDVYNYPELPAASMLLEITTPEDWHDGDGMDWYVVEGGLTTVMPPPPVYPELIAARARSTRNELLAAIDWFGYRHRDQIDRGDSTSLSTTKYSEYLTYRQALRDMPTQSGFPLSIEWPGSPI